MEAISKENISEHYLKIDTIWSEVEDNFSIKEEIISDVETEIHDFSEVNEGVKNDYFENAVNKFNESDDNHYSRNIISVNKIPLQTTRKKLKDKQHNRDNAEESEFVINGGKCSCIHDTKSFKIVNRRFRCGDCRSLVCPECFKIMFSTLHNHFLGFDTSNCNLYSCKFCSFPFQSICALQAHTRIHTMEAPYVCPDCGLIYSNAYFLILHLMKKCFHIYKIVSYKCPNCPGVYFTSDAFLKHIQDAHLSCTFRCSYCSLLFNNSEECNSHINSSHQKQKVQYLNYFRCTLCSNIVIPSFMYQKHVESHRENSESYEVEYQCLCGDVYSLIGAFRAHLQLCDKKGILPTRWRFLQKNLKSQDLMPAISFQEREDCVKASFPNESGFNVSSQVIRMGISEHCQATSPVAQEVELGPRSNESAKGTSGQASLESESFLISGRNPTPDKKRKENFSKSGALPPSPRNLNGIFATPCDDGPGNEASDKEIGETESKSNGENPQLNGNRISTKSDKSVEDGKSESDAREKDKSLYGYIPCDHLGYLKTQVPDSAKKEEAEGPIGESARNSPNSPDKYRVIVKLNEKTGVMESKREPIGNGENDVEEEELEEEAESDPSQRNPENVNYEEVIPKVTEKGKAKGNGISFFPCPFCVVLFPKNSSTFQQFKLHLEYYHADAAINILIKDNETDEPTRAVVESESEKWKKTVGKKYPVSKSQAGEGKKPLKKGKNSVKDRTEMKEEGFREREAKTEEGAESNEDDDEEDEEEEEDEEGKENSPKDANKNVKGNQLNGDVYWTVKLSVKSAGGAVSEKAVGSGDESKAAVVTRKKETSEAVQRGSGNRSSDSDEAAGKGHTEGKWESEKEKKTDSESADERAQKGREKKEKSGERRKTISDFEDEWENSKDSSWSMNSECEGTTCKMEKSEDSCARPRATEKSRRESEVWSEFYESLQLAERLKKSKKKKKSEPETHQEQQQEQTRRDAEAAAESATAKSSALLDYSSKRVVKKPKRYRESSASEGSPEDNEGSENEGDSGYGNPKQRPGSVALVNSDKENGAVDKRQKLLSKLEKMDHKFADYLFDLISKKEKCFELYKKHSNNRYGQDLRSYRKKVLNGIKLRGRPLKLLRYQELAKRNDRPSEEKSTELSAEGVQSQRGQRKHGETPPSESKSGERKRGRPRKMAESAKLKERRRSDREVDFIEKNFEREESGSSPSKRKRKLSTKLQYYKKMSAGSEEKDDFSSGQVITSKAGDPSKRFGCAVCKETFTEVSEFREHIVQHRVEENAYQCMECGECFVVRPSLEKHLHAFHKIKNTEAYIEENQCCNQKKEACDQESEPLRENQCKVCKDQFERAIDLTKHFRIHGMAFLREFKKEGKPKT